MGAHVHTQVRGVPFPRRQSGAISRRISGRGAEIGFSDWKAGGQVNYFKDFGEQWWSRWQDVMAKPADPSKLASLGIDFMVLKSEHKLGGRSAAFENSRFV